MADLGDIVDRIILEDQSLPMVDFAKVRTTGYRKGSVFEKYFKKRFFSRKEIDSFCKHCIEIIIQKHGNEAYAIQRFEADGFKFIVEYMDLTDDDDETCRCYSFFWSVEEC